LTAAPGFELLIPGSSLKAVNGSALRLSKDYPIETYFEKFRPQAGPNRPEISVLAKKNKLDNQTCFGYSDGYWLR
jgi:hypothetical protein